MNAIQILLKAQKECASVQNVPDEVQIRLTFATAKLQRVIYYLEYGITRYYDRVYFMSTGDDV